MSTPAPSLPTDSLATSTLSRSTSTAPSSIPPTDALKDSTSMEVDTPQPTYMDRVPSSVPSEDDNLPSTSTSSSDALAQGAIKPFSPVKQQQQQEQQAEVGPSTSTPGKRPASPDQEDEEEVTVSSLAAPAAGAVAGGSKDASKPAKKKRKSEAKGDTVYCHQDHQPHDVNTTVYLRCTGQKPVGKGKTMKPCNILYCERCLTNRYGEDAKAIKESGDATSWTCPSCRGICNCSTCRKKQGLDATGALKQLAKDQGITNAADLLNVMPTARSAAQKATSRLSATFTAGGKPAAQSLTRDSPSGGEKKPAKKGKGKKVKKEGGEDGAASDSSLSSLTDSDEENEEKKGGKGKGKKAAAPKGESKPKTAKAKSTGAGEGKGKDKATSPSLNGDGGENNNNKDASSPKPKKVFPPRAPPKLLSPPMTHPLTSTSYPHSTLPLTDSLLARLNLREFLLRFLPLIPSLRTGQHAPKAAHARALSALSDDVLWLWSDGDFAAETVQLTLLGGLVDFLLADKANSGAMWHWQRTALKKVREQVKLAKESGNGRIRDQPWETVAVSVLERGCEWVGRGREWARMWGERAGVEVSLGKAPVFPEDVVQEEEEEEGGEAEKEEGQGKGRPPSPVKANGNDKGKGKEKAKERANDDDGEESDLSDVDSASDEGEKDDEDDEMLSLPPSRKSKLDARRRVAAAYSDSEDDFSDPPSPDRDSSSSASDPGDEDEDDDEEEDEEVDMLASDYDEEAEQRKQELKKARRGKFERDTPAEERLALCCALVDMLMWAENMRAEMAQGIDDAAKQRTDLNKKRFQLRRDLADEKARIVATKPEKPAGNGASEKVKEWKEACDKVDEELEAAEVANKKEGWRIQHDLYLAAIRHRTRFLPLGTDCLGNSYYSFNPPPKKLLENPTAAAASGFPVHRSAADEAAEKDYPLSYCLVVHGKRPLASPAAEEPTPAASSPSRSRNGTSPPLAERAAATKAKAPKKEDKAVPGADSVLDSLSTTADSDEWWVVRGVDDLDSLADWLDSIQRHATFEHAFAVHHLEHTPAALGANKSHKTKKEIEALKALIPTKEEVEKRKERMEKGDEGLAEAVRQFAAYVRHARDVQAEESGERRVLRGH